MTEMTSKEIIGQNKMSLKGDNPYKPYKISSKEFIDHELHIIASKEKTKIVISLLIESRKGSD